MVKVLLTIVTTFSIKVHEKSLLEAFRACYQIHISTLIKDLTFSYSKHKLDKPKHSKGFPDSDDQYRLLQNGSVLWQLWSAAQEAPAEIITAFSQGQQSGR